VAAKGAAEAPSREVGWSELSALARVNVPDALAAWVRVKEAAENDLIAATEHARS
jgi:hypothetical protein